MNLLIRADGRTINLGPKTAVPVNPGVSNFISILQTIHLSRFIHVQIILTCKAIVFNKLSDTDPFFELKTSVSKQNNKQQYRIQIR